MLGSQTSRAGYLELHIILSNRAGYLELHINKALMAAEEFSTAEYSYIDHDHNSYLPTHHPVKK